jgi:kynurenine 3-monooxygenase
MNKPETITIAGAGLVGSLLSLYLAKRGHHVQLIERRPDSRRTSIYQGRSINLALSDRGWKALEAVGADITIRDIAIPMRRRVMHDVKGHLSYQPYGKDGQAIYSVSRGLLNQRLLDMAEALPNVRMHFEQKVVATDLEAASITTENTDGETHTYQADYLFGADGAFSQVRAAMLKRDRFSYEQEYIDHGYKELSIPPAEDGGFQLEKEALHIWPRGEYMLIALPNPDGTFTCTLFFPFEGDPSFSSLNTVEKARTFFEEQFPDALALMPDFDQEWRDNPSSSLCIIRCYPWVAGQSALIGDSAHAIVPFYGQGMNSGFEDCRILNKILDEESDWKVALERYQKERKANGDAIADLAMRNFIEMRDLTADPQFLLRKKIEAHLHQRYPDRWIPLYSMVTFTHIPYEEALRIGKVQDKIMAEVMTRPDIEEMWNSPEVSAAILEGVERYL